MLRKSKKQILFFLSLCFQVAPQDGTMKFLDLFGRIKSVVIGMIHVKALPGMTALTFSVQMYMYSGGGSIHSLYLSKSSNTARTVK